MNTAEAFAPPAERETYSGNLTSVVAAWAMAGATVGTGAGALLQLTGQIPSAAPPGLAAACAGAVLGIGAWLVDRRASAGRTAVVDGKGRWTRPASAWLMALPLAAGALGISSLVVLGTVRSGALEYGFAFLAILFALLWFTRPIYSHSKVGTAVALAQSGDVDAARRAFLAVADGWWITATARAMAQLNLGLLALQDGDLVMAERWYRLPAKGKTGAFAASGLALVHVLNGRYELAQDTLHKATSLGGASLQVEVDGVRLLLVLEREGPEAAYELGERLLAPNSGGLFCAALAVARHQTGRREEARELVDAGVGDAILASGIDRWVPGFHEVWGPYSAVS